MDTYEINKSLKDCKIYGGAWPCDLIPPPLLKPKAFVVNTDKSNKKGEHWCVIFINKDNSAEYFDSFGFPPLVKEIQDYLFNQAKSFIYNSLTLQHPSKKTCGLYCIKFIKHRCAGKSYKEFLSLFSRNLEGNEEIINNG